MWTGTIVGRGCESIVPDAREVRKTGAAGGDADALLRHLPYSVRRLLLKGFRDHICLRPCQSWHHWRPCHGPSLHRWHPGRSHSTVCPYGVQLIAVGAALSSVCRGCLWDWQWIIHCVSRLDPASLGYRLSCPCRICCCNLLKVEVEWCGVGCS